MAGSFHKAICLLTLSTSTLLLAGGCGPGVKDRGIVHGKVTFRGEPLTVGTVQFVTSDNRTGSAMIKEDGTYEMPDAPVGEVQIAVTVPVKGGISTAMKGGPGGVGTKGAPGGVGTMPPGAGGGSGGKIAPKAPEGVLGGGDGYKMGPPPTLDLTKAVRIPDKYAKPETSGLTYTVTRGDQTHDIPLTP
jgi:hypothetical protein